MKEQLVAMTRSDHQGADAQGRSCPLMVSVLPQREHCSARSSELCSWLVSSGAPPTSVAVLSWQSNTPRGLPGCERVQAGLRDPPHHPVPESCALGL